MRKVGIVVTAILLVVVLGVMLVSVGVIPIASHRQPRPRIASLPHFSHRLERSSEHTAEIRPKLSVSTPHGRIEITGAEVEQIEITMLVETSASTLERTQELLDQVALDIATGSRQTLLTVKVPRLASNEMARADLIILVPQEMELDLDTSLGDVQVTDIHGSLKVHTSLGTILVRDHQGSAANLRSSLGSVEVVSSAFAERFTAVSDLGDVSVSGSLAQHTVLKASLGDVRVHLPAGESYVLDGRVHLGSIYVGVPFTGQQTDKRITGTIGEGEQRGTISADVSLGSLRLSN